MTNERAERCLALRIKVYRGRRGTDNYETGSLVTVMNHSALVDFDDSGETWMPLKLLRQA